MFEPQIVTIISSLGVALPIERVKVWAVFLLCLLFTGAGVGLSFLVFGTTITGVRLWGVGLVLAVTMLGVTYSAKYASESTRTSFTPIDLIQYLSQGFLWPSVWPAFADLIGLKRIEPPVQNSDALSELSFLFGAIVS